jgi:hypothetical protein
MTALMRLSQIGFEELIQSIFLFFERGSHPRSVPIRLQWREIPKTLDGEISCLLSEKSNGA